MSGLTIEKLDPSNQNEINRIAGWYHTEWKIPIEKTTERLLNQDPNDVLFQLVLKKNNTPIATGGLYNIVGILFEHERFRKFKPWVALLYTTPENRHCGYGAQLLSEIEIIAKKTGIPCLYLYTFTAEALYLKNGWKPMERVIYKGHNTVIMSKEI